MLHTHAHSCLFSISNRHYKHNMSTKSYGFDPKLNIPNTCILKIGTPVNPIAQDTHTHTHTHTQKSSWIYPRALFSLSLPLPPSISCSLHQIWLTLPSNIELAKKLLWVFYNIWQNLNGLFGQPSISFFF